MVHNTLDNDCNCSKQISAVFLHMLNDPVGCVRKCKKARGRIAAFCRAVVIP